MLSDAPATAANTSSSFPFLSIWQDSCLGSLPHCATPTSKKILSVTTSLLLAISPIRLLWSNINDISDTKQLTDRKKDEEERMTTRSGYSRTGNIFTHDLARHHACGTNNPDSETIFLRAFIFSYFLKRRAEHGGWVGSSPYERVVERTIRSLNSIDIKSQRKSSQRLHILWNTILMRVFLLYLEEQTRA